MPLFCSVMDRPILMDLVLPVPGRHHSKFSWFLRSISMFHWHVQTWGLNLHGKLTKCPVVLQLGCIPRNWAIALHSGRQKCQLWSLPFLANPLEMLWEMMREIRSLRSLCRKQEFYYASRIRGDKFSKTWALLSVRRWVIYPPRGLCNQEFFCIICVFWSIWVSYRERSWLQILPLPTP
jgi:hypothetical protein